ncbi:MAG: hypothetical protein R2939_01960 [Kofleriaceae bacterium]
MTAAAERVVGLIALALAASCELPSPAVICHNANCAGEVDPSRDDTLPALAESLALTYRGRPAIDGVELDLFWRGSDDACIFSHDLDQADPAPAMDAAAALAAYLAQPGPITASERPFEVLLELKPHVDAAEVVAHTPAQRTAHAACAWQVYDAIAAAALASGHEAVVTMSSYAPALLAEVLAQAPGTPPIPARLGALQGVPAPLDGQTSSLDAYAGLPIAVVEVHPHWLLDGQAEAIASLGADLSLWMFSATAETFALIRQHQPVTVVTSEALLMRRWLAR